MAPRASKRSTNKAEGGGPSNPPAPPAAQGPSAEEAKKPAKRPRTQLSLVETDAKPSAAAPARPKRRAQAAATASPSDAEADSGPGSDAAAEPNSDGDANVAAAPGNRKVQAKINARLKPRVGAAKAGGGTAAAAPRDPPGPRYFLMKSEPEEFSLDDLAAKPNQTSHWEGVRNAQARNIMRSMRLGDQAFFYHSSCKVPAVVGVVQVVREAYPDHFAFDKSSKYHDPSSTPDAPKWWMVDVQLVRRMARPVTLAELRREGDRGPPITDMVLINKSRLSVQPVSSEQWGRILELECEPQEGEDGQRGGVQGKGKQATKKEAAQGKGAKKANDKEEEAADDDDEEEAVEEGDDKGKGSRGTKAGAGGGGRASKRK